jgi:hypothetical protein
VQPGQDDEMPAAMIDSGDSVNGVAAVDARNED